MHIVQIELIRDFCIPRIIVVVFGLCPQVLKAGDGKLIISFQYILSEVRLKICPDTRLGMA